MKKTTETDHFFLNSMLDAIGEIDYHEQSNSDAKTKFRAILFELATIGEAATKISQDLKKKYPGVDWLDIAGTRHKIVHEYFRINPKIIANIVENHLSDLKHSIEVILEDLEQSHG